MVQEDLERKSSSWVLFRVEKVFKDGQKLRAALMVSTNGVAVNTLEHHSPQVWANP